MWGLGCLHIEHSCRHFLDYHKGLWRLQNAQLRCLCVLFDSRELGYMCCKPNRNSIRYAHWQLLSLRTEKTPVLSLKQREDAKANAI